MKKGLTTAEVIVRTSLLARGRAFVGYRVTDMAKPAATLHTPDSRTVCPVCGTVGSIEDTMPTSIRSGSHTRRHNTFHL
jgi:hypothetical protein